MELYIGNLPWSVTDEALTSMLAAHGTVVRAKVVMDRDSGRSRGFGFATMGSEAEGKAAIAALNGKDQEGRAITVRVAEPRQAGGQGGGQGGGDRQGGYRGNRA